MYRLLTAIAVFAGMLSGITAADERGVTVAADGAVSGWLDGQSVSLGTYHALLIGIDSYQHTAFAPRLRTPVADVKHLRDQLVQHYGFDAANVRLLVDAQATRAGILGALNAMRDAPLGATDNLLVYFAGHGYQRPDTEDGFWIPVDGTADETSWVSVGEIRRIVSKVRAKHTLLLSDSCFSGTLTRAAVTIPLNDRFLAEVSRKDSYQVITSGGLEPVADGGRDGLSLFGYTLTSYLQGQTKAYVTASQLYSDLAPLVANASDSLQTPEHGKIPGTYDQNGEFVFARVDLAVSATPQVAVAPAPSTNTAAPTTAPTDGAPVGTAKIVTDASALLGGKSMADILSAMSHEPGEVFRDPMVNAHDGPEMIVVPVGGFEMGYSGGSPNNRPVHEVLMGTPFAIGCYEVTVAEYSLFDPRTRSQKDSPKSVPAMSGVSWEDAVKYTDWLSAQTGKSYRLPNEAEWEYIARAGTTTIYWWGDEVTRSRPRAHCADCGKESGALQPIAVGSFPANDFGAYDTAGNVAEWVSDCWHDSYDGAPAVQSNWETGTCLERVTRGGSFRTPARWITNYERTRLAPEPAQADSMGFRVARDL